MRLYLSIIFYIFKTFITILNKVIRNINSIFVDALFIERNHIFKKKRCFKLSINAFLILPFIYHGYPLPQPYFLEKLFVQFPNLTAVYFQIFLLSTIITRTAFWNIRLWIFFWASTITFFFFICLCDIKSMNIKISN